MTIVLNPEYDPTLRAIAMLLTVGLNELDTQVVVAQAFDYDGFVSGQGLNFPLLQLFRQGGSGQYLEISELTIEYYLGSPNQAFERPGLLRLVEVAIARLLDLMPYQGLSNCARLRTDQLKVERGFLDQRELGIFPYTRLTLPVEEINVKLPVLDQQGLDVGRLFDPSDLADYNYLELEFVDGEVSGGTVTEYLGNGIYRIHHNLNRDVDPIFYSWVADQWMSSWTAFVPETSNTLLAKIPPVGRYMVHLH